MPTRLDGIHRQPSRLLPTPREQVKSAPARKWLNRRQHIWGLIFLIVVANWLPHYPSVWAALSHQQGGSPASEGGGHVLRQPFANSNGLVGWWKFDGDATDSGPNGYNGTLNNFVGGTTDGYVTTSKFGKALKFNNSTYDYVSTSNATAIQQIGNNFSVSLWVNPNSSQATYADMLGDHYSTASGGFAIEQYSNTTNSYYLTWTDGTTFYCAASNNTLNLTSGVWQHVVYVKNDTTLTMYLNGVSTNSCTGASATVANTTYQFSIGNSDYVVTRAFNGSLDDVRIYNRAISPAEVTQLYQGSQPPAIDQTLRGYWKLDENGSTATTADATSNGNTGTLTNFTFDGTTNGWVGGNYGNGLLFNGGTTYVSVPDSTSLGLTSTGTIEFWVYFVTASSSCTLLWKNNVSTAATTNYGVQVHNTAGNSSAVYAVLGNGTTSISIQNNITALLVDVGKWMHVAVTWDGSTFTAYKNGKFGRSTTQTITPATNTQPLQLGGIAGTATCNAIMDDVRIYNRALPQYEIVDQYMAGRSY